MSKATITVESFIANDLEVKTAGTHRVVELSLPHTPQKQVEGAWVDAGPTTWFSATFWDEFADGVLVSVNKGTLVTVTGVPELEVYTKRDGTAGAKIKLQFPTLAVVVRKPKRGAPAASPAAAEVWAPSAPAAESADVWATPAAFTDETPF